MRNLLASLYIPKPDTQPFLDSFQCIWIQQATRIHRTYSTLLQNKMKEKNIPHPFRPSPLTYLVPKQPKIPSPQICTLPHPLSQILHHKLNPRTLSLLSKAQTEATNHLKTTSNPSLDACLGYCRGKHDPHCKSNDPSQCYKHCGHSLGPKPIVCQKCGNCRPKSLLSIGSRGGQTPLQYLIHCHCNCPDFMAQRTNRICRLPARFKAHSHSRKPLLVRHHPTKSTPKTTMPKITLVPSPPTLPAPPSPLTFHIHVPPPQPPPLYELPPPLPPPPTFPTSPVTKPLSWHYLNRRLHPIAYYSLFPLPRPPVALQDPPDLPSFSQTKTNHPPPPVPSIPRDHHSPISTPTRANPERSPNTPDHLTPHCKEYQQSSLPSTPPAPNLSPQLNNCTPQLPCTSPQLQPYPISNPNLDNPKPNSSPPPSPDSPVLLGSPQRASFPNAKILKSHFLQLQVNADGDCCFHAIFASLSKQTHSYKKPPSILELRKLLFSFASCSQPPQSLASILSLTDQEFDNVLQKYTKPSSWVSDIVIQIAALALQVTFCIWLPNPSNQAFLTLKGIFHPNGSFTPGRSLSIPTQNPPSAKLGYHILFQNRHFSPLLPSNQPQSPPPNIPEGHLHGLSLHPFFSNNPTIHTLLLQEPFSSINPSVENLTIPPTPPNYPAWATSSEALLIRARIHAFSLSLSIKPSTIPSANLGLFSSHPIPPGTVLGPYTGKYHLLSPNDNQEAPTPPQHPVTEEHWDLHRVFHFNTITSSINPRLHLFLYGSRSNCLTYINHSKKPNVSLEICTGTALVRIIALENPIPENTELLMDYGHHTTPSNIDFTEPNSPLTQPAPQTPTHARRIKKRKRKFNPPPKLTNSKITLFFRPSGSPPHPVLRTHDPHLLDHFFHPLPTPPFLFPTSQGNFNPLLDNTLLPPSLLDEPQSILRPLKRASQQAAHLSLSIRFNPSSGWGVYSMSKIQPNTILGIYEGKFVFTPDSFPPPAMLEDPRESFLQNRIIQLRKPPDGLNQPNVFILGSRASLSTYFNEPNSRLESQALATLEQHDSCPIIYIQTKNITIEPNSHITVSYGPSFPNYTSPIRTKKHKPYFPPPPPQPSSPPTPFHHSVLALPRFLHLQTLIAKDAVILLPMDGNCLYRGLASLALNSQSKHPILREAIYQELINNPIHTSNYLINNPNTTSQHAQTHFNSLRKDKIWGDEFTIAAFNSLYLTEWHLCIWRYSPLPFSEKELTHQLPNSIPSQSSTLYSDNCPTHPDKPTIHLWYVDNSHYNVILPTTSNILTGYQILHMQHPVLHHPPTPRIFPPSTKLGEDILEALSQSNSPFPKPDPLRLTTSIHTLLKHINPLPQSTLIVWNCGNGAINLLTSALSHISSVIGIDPSEQNIEQATSALTKTHRLLNTPLPNIHFIHLKQPSQLQPALQPLLPPHPSPVHIISTVTPTPNYHTIKSILPTSAHLASITSPLPNTQTTAPPRKITIHLPNVNPAIQLFINLEPPRAGIG